MLKRTKIQKVNVVLNSLFEKREWHYRLGLNQIFLFWRETVGQDVAERAQPYVIRGNVLWVGVLDSLSHHDFHLQKISLLEKINRRLRSEWISSSGQGLVPQLNDLRFQIVANLAHRAEEYEKELIAKTPIAKTPIDSEKEQSFVNLVKSIKNDELRSRMLRLWRNLAQRLD